MKKLRNSRGGGHIIDGRGHDNLAPALYKISLDCLKMNLRNKKKITENVKEKVKAV